MRRIMYVVTAMKTEHARSSQLQEAKLTVGSKIQVRVGVDYVPAWVPIKPTQSAGTTLSFALLCDYTTE
jgi:hypothetical protein